MRIQSFILLLIFISYSTIASAGYLGLGTSSYTSKTFDHQQDGFRFDFGSNINNTLDLEFNIIDFGASGFDDPTYTSPDPDDTTDRGSFQNGGFGTATSSDGGLTYTGIDTLSTYGISAGFKLKKSIKSWLQLYARASFLAWESTTNKFEIYTPRQLQNDDGDIVFTEQDATNQNPCGNFDYCRQEVEGNKHQAVDFWYGYGFIIKPTSWMAIRTEYSIVTLNAVEFPKGVLEGLSASLEIHF